MHNFQIFIRSNASKSLQQYSSANCPPPLIYNTNTLFLTFNRSNIKYFSNLVAQTKFLSSLIYNPFNANFYSLSLSLSLSLWYHIWFDRTKNASVTIITLLVDVSSRFDSLIQKLANQSLTRGKTKKGPNYYFFPLIN